MNMNKKSWDNYEKHKTRLEIKTIILTTIKLYVCIFAAGARCQHGILALAEAAVWLFTIIVL